MSAPVRASPDYRLIIPGSHLLTQSSAIVSPGSSATHHQIVPASVRFPAQPACLLIPSSCPATPSPTLSSSWFTSSALGSHVQALVKPSLKLAHTQLSHTFSNC
ncbi:hypothetical protein PHYPO_G00205000 [Pangasianodon hypophthalmus]|uniref:Uncharacterized protein n=1 Tax=Pangasianodon hypophthalmus TaxID=310915 RepID=A0A5N5PBF0_PANHP|nr:hypothetical protein PHYPO_G00205000 [Pangasianodon hypophthalmus]